MSKKKKPAPEAVEGEAPAKGGGGKKKLIMIAAAVVLIGGGAGGYFMMGGSGSGHGGGGQGGGGHGGGGHGAEAAHDDKKGAVAFVDIQEMTVNLASEPNQDRPRFLRFKLALEVKDAKIVPDVQPLLPRVQDIFQVFVRELRASDLEGSGGLHRLREELLRRVNIAVAPSRVDAVLFKEVVVQ